MKKTAKVLIGGSGNPFQYLSQQLDLAGFNSIEVSSNPLEIQFESMTSKPDAVFLDSALDNMLMLIKNLKRLTNPPAIYIIQSPYEVVKNKKLEGETNNYYENPLNIKLIINVLKDDIEKRDKNAEGNSNFENKLHNIISVSLNKLCVTPNYNGYMFLREAIKMAVLEPINSRGFSTRIYPKIAVEYGVTPASVERNIRTAIVKSWGRASLSDKAEIFGAFSSNPQWRPTNGEFILIIADKINREFLNVFKAVN